ncbi:GNAT family N-acetyltransferase [Radiobacillus deserti]|uniref:GNAT family N-acetyltransferase n=1 Tax=Radiobacillus deserti TaxID=2594883 RepID=A0A516KFU5_9BACI|nr:GNAT family N-acetyltransferase [Radiobacillus deserti]QDP40268.1 GNAT family N-acetyltransferase [Radiobacillus deserti]
MELIQTEELLIRRMKETDYERLTQWLNNKDVLEFWDTHHPPNIQRVKEKYGPRVKDLEEVKPCIVEVQGRPVGYIQYYRIHSEEIIQLGYAENESVFGMDQLIGISSQLGKGIGTKMVKALIEYIAREQKGTVIVMDPSIRNERAIRCYEKCGFIKKKIINEKYWLMERRM